VSGKPLAPVAVTRSFIDAINHGDVDRPVAWMTADHRLVVLAEEPPVGRDANRDAWKRSSISWTSVTHCPGANFRHGATSLASVRATTDSS
jgi:ketosteroid isomerase-like protein